MYDELDKSGATLDYKSLGVMLGMPIVPTIASEGFSGESGLKELFKTVVKVFNQNEPTSRHIHITHADRVRMDLLDVDKVSVRINGIKGGIMENVTLKESDNYVLEMHIDTDDANAHLINQGDIGEIIK